MSDPKLLPASADDLANALAYALRYNGRKRVHTGDEMMARITAEQLIAHLEQAGFVVMKKSPAQPHSNSGHGRAPMEG
ncbi:MAG TPA: hypothetical protein VE690_09105 [Rhodopila sp.]|jgi:hypothetical protein|nr:hypothetical protein [Rhodopila sp.]